MDSLARLQTLAGDHRLAVIGAFVTTSGDPLPPGRTLALLGPAEPGFWPHVTQQPEFADGAPDPIDRWSARVIAGLAGDLGGSAHFPFGTPAMPFLGWAIRTGRIHVSPVRLLVHGTMGLWVSFRGAVLLPDAATPPAAMPSPCETCATRPCLTACPVAALTGAGYDLTACHGFLDTDAGQTCMSRGCAVRRACPAGAGYGRLDAQSAFHMHEFHT